MGGESTPPALDLDALALLLTPYKRDPHPCIERCWRIGGGVTLDQCGRCPECGMTADRNTSTDVELPRATVLSLIAAARRLARLESALEFLDKREGTPNGGKAFAEPVQEILRRATSFGWRHPEGGSDG